MSRTPLVSPGTRFVAMESKATTLPSPEIRLSVDWALPTTPALDWLTRWTALLPRFRTKTSALFGCLPAAARRS